MGVHKDLIGGEDLDRIWGVWFLASGFTGHWENTRYSWSEWSISKKNPIAQKFADYIWENGGEIIQIDGRRYLRFLTEQQRTWFLIKHIPAK